MNTSTNQRAGILLPWISLRPSTINTGIGAHTLPSRRQTRSTVICQLHPRGILTDRPHNCVSVCVCVSAKLGIDVFTIDPKLWRGEEKWGSEGRGGEKRKEEEFAHFQGDTDRQSLLAEFIILIWLLFILFESFSLWWLKLAQLGSWVWICYLTVLRFVLRRSFLKHCTSGEPV